MTINFNYDKKFTEAYVNAQTDSYADIDVLNIGYKGLTFLKQVFKNYPEYFSNLGSVLFYIECGGKTIKPDFLYLAFENMITNSNNNIIKAKLNNIPLYTITQDTYIQWARYLQATSIFHVMEPVMSVCNEVLKKFINDGKNFVYKNINLSIGKIKPLCVNNLGENIADLTIYVAYLYNFFINCEPFKFNEVIAGSSTQLFTEAINNHINNYFTRLINEAAYISKNGNSIDNNFKFNSLDSFYSDVENITYFKEEDIINTIKGILNLNKILEIRNNIALTVCETEGDITITNQNIIQYETCYKGYLNVLSNLIDIIVKNNFYYKNIFSFIPSYGQNSIDYHELALLTSYALSSGEKPFIIDECEQYKGCCDVNSLKSYPDIDKQELITKINKPSIVNYKPFISSNVFLDIITGYVAEKFENRQNNVLTNRPIEIDDTLLNNTKIRIDKILNALYINGKFGLYSSSIESAMKYLWNNNNLLFEWKSVLYLCNLFNVIYDNKLASIVLPAYILSFFPEYLLKYMTNNKNNNLNKFDYLIYFCLHHTQINELRINKLTNMALSIMYLYTDSYVDFVNKQASNITKILTTNAIISQPYIKMITDHIDVICIGGVSLGMKYIDTNPLSRGYYFVESTQGTSEQLNSFYEFSKRITNNDTFELINTAIKTNNNNSLKDTINQAATILYNKNKLPLMLSSYTINTKTGEYSYNDYSFIMNLTTTNNIPIYKLITAYIFPEINANHIQTPAFYSRQININSTTNKPLENKIEFNGEVYSCSVIDRGIDYNIPIYDFSTSFNNISLSFAQPNGFKLLQINTPNGELMKNNCFFVFTNNIIYFDDDDTQPVFNVYDTINNDISTGLANKDGETGTTLITTELPTTATASGYFNGTLDETRGDRFKTNRIQLLGVDKQPIPDTVNGVD